MSICDKIRNIDNLLEDNLNNRGVDSTFGMGTGEQTIYDMSELISKQNLMGIGDANIQKKQLKSKNIWKKEWRVYKYRSKTIEVQRT